MKNLYLIFCFLSLFALEKCCTPIGQDPYQTGSLVECCPGSHQVLNNWDPSDPSRWYYICQPDSQSGLIKGIALIPNNHNCGDIAALGGSWFYNWGTNAADCINNGEEFIPMIWGPANMGSIGSLPQSSWVLGFNEPNQGGQANMSPSDAASLWPQFESINRNLVGPAVAMGGTMGGTDWYQQFFQSCSNCRVDAIAIHIYENNLGAFQYWVGQFKQFNKPIWITEWAFPNLSSDCSELMREVLDYFKTEPLVQRIGFFGSRLNSQFSDMTKCSLMNPDNTSDMSLYPPGQVYHDDA